MCPLPPVAFLFPVFFFILLVCQLYAYNTHSTLQIKVLRRYYERVGTDHSKGVGGGAENDTTAETATGDVALAAEGIMQLQEVVIHSIATVSDAPRGVGVHLPSKEFDLYALLEIEPGDGTTEPLPDETPSVNASEDAEHMECDNDLAIANPAMPGIDGDDIDSFEELLFSWK